MHRVKALVWLALVPMLLVACTSGVESTGPPPPAYTFDIVGEIAAQSVANNRLIFSLESGRTVELDEKAVRVLFETGETPRLLVTGRDAIGDCLVVVGKQDGMPPDCNVVNREGREWGAGIELVGLVWPKAPAFRADTPIPARGSPYPDGTRFCLDDHARLAAVIGP